MDTTSAGTLSIAEGIRQLSNVAGELEGEFRRQREILKRNGMGLPPGTLAGVQAIYTDLAALAGALDHDRVELEQLRALSQTANLINSTLNLDDVLNGVVQAVISLTGAERGYLVLRDLVSGELEFKVARTIQGTMREDEFIISKTIVEEVARTGIPVVTSNAETDKTRDVSASIIGLRLRSILCVPLVLRGEVSGVIYADNRIKEGVFGQQERELLYAFANQAAIAIENARLFERARGSLAEVTALKAVMDNVFASIASGVITTDAQHCVTTLNDAAEHILQIRRGDALGKHYAVALPTFAKDFEARHQNVMQNNTQETLETTPTIAGRARVSLTLKLSPLRDSDHRTQGVAIVVDDVTELAERSAQLEAVRPYLPAAMIENIQSIDQLGLGGERRETTVMYVDVRAFATFPPGLNPRDFMIFLNEHLTVANDQIVAQNGVVDKYMANEVMALFNTQLNPDANHVYRSVLAALGIANAFREYYAARGEGDYLPFYRTGIHTGIATLGNAGSKSRKEFTALGDTVNLAHRLLETAAPGQVLISRETYDSCADLLHAIPGVQIAERGAIPVKGRQQPVFIYEVGQPQ